MSGRAAASAAAALILASSTFSCKSAAPVYLPGHAGVADVKSNSHALTQGNVCSLTTET